MKLAAIDIGSNSIKLAVVDAAASDSFAVLAREKETVRLGHETLREEFLSPTAVERAADCVKRFRSIAEARGAERVIANVARYHRGSPPKDKHQDYARLGQADRETVRRLAAILRVADALDRSHDSRVSELRCARDAQTLCLQLSSELDCDREIAAAESKSELFEEVFGCELALSQ